jgi:endogenous inhibitor of DNA gyrase (YacG/DUF329 family)
MPDLIKEVTCSRCGHNWYVNFTELDRDKQLIYKGVMTQRTYSVPCPNCGTRKTLKVEITEDDDA